MSFVGPETLAAVPASGIDSCVLQFMDSDCLVLGGRGGYSSGLSADGVGASSGYRRERTTVDGHKASLVRAVTNNPDRPYFAGVHVPLGDSEIGDISAELYVSCDAPEARDAIAPMLRTLQIEEE